jgi:phenylpropionate dioxygenase-like ring-hydroxylating dioxygenase large terminal subunit
MSAAGHAQRGAAYWPVSPGRFDTSRRNTMLQNVEHRKQKMADYTTPLVKNCWYVAALSSEVSRGLQERTLLGKTLLMYRKLDGAPVFMQNRCVHRNFPLSKGRLDGDQVVCGYHGMSYNPQGTCVFMPSLAKPPSHAQLQSYPVVEKAPLIWIWMGDPAKADPALIPETPWLDDPAWATVGGQFHMNSNYVAMHENLLDQTHFSVLHADTVGTPEYARSELDVRVEGDVVALKRSLRNAAPPPIYGIPMKLTGRQVDRFSDSKFPSPALHIAHAKIVNLEPAPGELVDYLVNITHLFTPETQGSIHYWWFNSRNFGLDDEAASKYLIDASNKAYQEDVDALTWIQAEVEKESEPIEELSFGPDRPGIAMRKILLRLATEESAAAESVPAAVA